MGKPCFSKLTKFFAFALLGAATAIAAIAVLSSPAAAQNPGGGNGDTEKSWDTDNLRFGSYSARSFAIPHLNSGNRGSHEACGSGVVDGFFQLDPDVRNDLPILDVTVSSDGTPSVAHRAASTCSEFVANQELALRFGRSGFYLDHRGVLRRGLPGRISMRSYDSQRWSGTSQYQGGKFRIDANATYDGYSLVSYAASIDYYTGSRSLANAKFRGAGNDGFAVPHSIELVVNTQKSGSVYTWTPRFPASAGVTAGTAMHLQARDYQRLCPSGFHPRGEDAARRIGNGTGRTLSSLDQPGETRLADQYWCRSDVRKQIWYEPEVVPKTCGPGRTYTCPAGVTIPTGHFQAYGRVGCYYTATGLETTGMQRGSRAIQGTLKNTCSYIYPVPQCTENGTKRAISNPGNWYAGPLGSPQVFPFASDGSTACDTNPRCTANGAKRDMTSGELQAYRTARGASFVPASDGSTPCTIAVAASAAADFTADACVTAILEIYENRPKGFDAEPGVRADHRTVTADAASPVFDLDVAAAHPGTASPPRAAGDPSGCADGSESRADHGTADSAARKNTAAEDATTTDTKSLPKSSAAVNSQHPPHSKSFGSPGTDYTGAVRNMAHRYASDVAENTCAAAREFAELVLEILKGRRLVFQSYIDGYEDTIDTAIAGYSSYSTTIQSGSENSANAYNNLSLKEMRQNALERQREKYVKDRKEYLGLLKAALENAETAYQRATNSTKLVLGSVDSNGCINSYNNAITGEIAKLKDLAEAAETAFPSTAIERNVTLTNKTYRATNSITNPNKTTGGTDRFMRLYNALSLQSYTDQVPNYTVTSSPKSDTRASRYRDLYSRTDNYRNVVSGTVTGTLSGTTGKKANFSRTYTGSRICEYATGTITSGTLRRFASRTSPRCGTGAAIAHNTATGTTLAAAKATVKGTAHSVTLPSETQMTTARPSALAAVTESSLLGKLHPSHSSRTNLKAATAAARNTAAANLGTLTQTAGTTVIPSSFAAALNYTTGVHPHTPPGSHRQPAQHKEPP